MIFFVEDDGSDSSDVEVVELPAGSIPVRGSRGGNGRLPGRGGGRGEERSSTGEGTSRGPGELGSNFNPSRNQTNNRTNKQTKQVTKQQEKKQTFAGQAEAIVRSAAAASSGQDDDFVDDPVFDDLLCADASDINVGTVRRGNPGWLSAQMSSMSSSTSINYCLIKPLDR